MERQYLPDNLHKQGVKYYEPTENGKEGAFKRYLESLKKVIWKLSLRKIPDFCFGVKEAIKN